MKLFYSYCHSDAEFREDLEKHLSVLKRGGEISEWWCDRHVLPGQELEAAIEREMANADIIVLLISSDFLASCACVHEMTTALQLRDNNPTLVIPVILRPCDWQHSDISSLLALPTDGKPVTDWKNRDEAFVSIVDGIRKAISESRFHLKQGVATSFTETDFATQEKKDVRLDDIFVFPNLTIDRNETASSIDSFQDIMSAGRHLVIRGDYRSGKTTICRKLLLKHAEKETPVLMFSGHELTPTLQHEDLIFRKFHEMFDGPFIRWKKSPGKVLIVDDLQSSSNLSFVAFAKTYFESVIITMSKDDYIAFFKDEQRLASFEMIAIESLKHAQQECLIRKWKTLSSDRVTDGVIDQLEDRLNSIVLDKKVVPRFPFYVLSILQAYEAFMPQTIQITAFGHCYQALITAQIVRAGINNDDVDSVFNFLSHFSYFLFSRDQTNRLDSFESFVKKYRSEFIIKASVLHRITGGPRPLLQRNGNGYEFHYPYVYYFLLGYYFARHREERKMHISEMLEHNYIRDNALVIIFTIHHAYDRDLIDTILAKTRDALRETTMAKLDNSEVRMLETALREIPENVISRRSVMEERKIERDSRDKAEAMRIQSDEHSNDVTNDNRIVSEVLISLKSMKILGQILRNKYGSLPVNDLGRIVSTMADAGLRVVGVITDRHGIDAFDNYIEEMVAEVETDTKSVVLDEIGKKFRAYIIGLVYIVLKIIAESIGKKELRDLVSETVREKRTMAYDLIGAFYSLSSAESLTDRIVDQLVGVLDRCDREKNLIAWRLVSLDTQIYLNTHQVKIRLRQRLYSALKLQYKPNQPNQR